MYGDLEAVMADEDDAREQLMSLPATALLDLLGSDECKVQAESTVLMAATEWVTDNHPDDAVAKQLAETIRLPELSPVTLHGLSIVAPWLKASLWHNVLNDAWLIQSRPSARSFFPKRRKLPAAWVLGIRPSSIMTELIFESAVRLDRLSRVFTDNVNIDGPQYSFIGSKFSLLVSRAGKAAAWTLGAFLQSSIAVEVEYTIRCDAASGQQQQRRTKAGLVSFVLGHRAWGAHNFFALPTMSQWQPELFAPWATDGELRFTVKVKVP
jgi:hypothetical protein